MKTIYKYEVDLSGNIYLPTDAVVIHIANQCNIFNVWAIVDKTAKVDKNNPPRFKIVGTGWDLNSMEDYTHLKTFLVGSFVWHLFEHSVDKEYNNEQVNTHKVRASIL